MPLYAGALPDAHEPDWFGHAGVNVNLRSVSELVFDVSTRKGPGFGPGTASPRYTAVPSARIVPRLSVTEKSIGFVVVNVELSVGEFHVTVTVAHAGDV